jgi:hypothetical protein
MAVTKTVLKNTNNETIVKIAGTAASSTITLNSDCLASTQALDGATQTVNIVGFQFTGLASSTITIARNSTNITTVSAEGHDDVEFAAGMGFADTIQNTSDIVVTIGGAEAQLYLTLRKIGGYATKVEEAVYGAYDDRTRVGASTTLSGSPDKV